MIGSCDVETEGGGIRISPKFDDPDVQKAVGSSMDPDHYSVSVHKGDILEVSLKPRPPVGPTNRTTPKKRK